MTFLLRLPDIAFPPFATLWIAKPLQVAMLVIGIVFATGTPPPEPSTYRVGTFQGTIQP